MSLREPERGRQLLEPGRVYEVEIDLWATAYRLGAGHRLRVADGGLAPAAGESVRLFVRPEALELVPVGSDGPTGVVLARTFLGEKVEYQVRLGTDVLQVTRYNPTPGAVFSPGQSVAIKLPSDGVRLLREAT